MHRLHPSQMGGRWVWVFFLFFTFQSFAFHVSAQINTDRVMLMGRNALYYEDYVLSIQRFNMVISAKPYLSEPYFFRGLAKFYLEDYVGAEQDCSASLERNPYVSNSYQLRGLCRVNRKNFQGAVQDYRKVIQMEPKNQACWHNMVLCEFELKHYAEADSALDQMIRYWPKRTENLTMKAQLSIAQGDTIRALAFIDSALVLDSYDAQAWTMRSMISLQRGEYAQAEGEIDKAIIQRPRMAGNFINRALARFHQDNLRGAMDDYDQALELEPNNYLGHFNRGLLRAQVGDDNRAIEDFNFVLSLEPDNMIALYNRALLLDQTGDYNGALRDISAVIEEYPEFWTGYMQRAAVRRKLGDTYGAERDEFKVMKARLDTRTGNRKPSPQKTRKQSDRDIEDYASIVEADSDEPQREYESAYRGRVQDRRVELSPQPIYVVAQHSFSNPTSRFIPFHRLIVQLNSSGVLPLAACLTNLEPQLEESEIQKHFADIQQLTARIEESKSPVATLYVARALAEYHVRDFEGATMDLERAFTIDEHNALIPFMIAQIRCRQTEAQSADEETTSMTTRLAYSRALDELQRAATLQPDFAYVWYNIGVIQLYLHDYHQAREAFTRALNIDATLPAAYYNRGISCILDGQVQLGLSDLSQAGEYGLYQAYNLIKRYSKEKASKNDGK